MKHGAEGNRRAGRLPSIMLVVLVTSAAACGAGAPQVAGTTTTTTLLTGTSSTSTATTVSPVTTAPPTTKKKQPPISGPPSPKTALQMEPVDWYNELKDLQPSGCVQLIQDTAFLNDLQSGGDVGPREATAYVFRGSAKGCLNDLAGSRSDLACAKAFKSNFLDPKVGQLLDWAIATFGPVKSSCALAPPTTTSTSTTTAP